VSELLLLVMRIGFLLLLWFFIFAIVYALRSDLFGAPVRKLQGEAQAQRSSPPAAAPIAPPAASEPTGLTHPPSPPVITPSGGTLPSAGGDGPRTLVITSGASAGTTLPLDDDIITIGRSTDSTLAILDEYTSTYHARLARKGNEWLLTDLDSTNGTKLNGSRVTGTVLVPNFAPVTIGTTTFELRP